jgi:hypothetical protein
MFRRGPPPARPIRLLEAGRVNSPETEPAPAAFLESCRGYPPTARQRTSIAMTATAIATQTLAEE